MTYKKEDFLSWLRNTYDIEFNDKIGIVDKFFEWLNSEGGRAPENSSTTSNSNEGQVPKAKDEDGRPLYGGNTIHFTEVTDNNGRVWYEEYHFYSQPDEARHLQKGDAIVFKRVDKGVEVYGFMIISSFDFKSDFAARALIGKLPYVWEDDKHISYTYYGGFCPSIWQFSIATEEEIEQFFKEWKEDDKEYKTLANYYKDRCSENEELEKYLKYFEED